MFTHYKNSLGLLNDDEDKNENNNKSEDISFLNRKVEKLFFEKRAVYFWGSVDDKSCREILQKILLLEYDKPGEPIEFFINSPGGVISSGLAIYDTIGLLKSPVHTICMGIAASMGSIFLCVGKKGKRFIYPHGEVMIHQPLISGYFQATSSDIEIQANQIKKTKDIMANILAQHCDKSFDEVILDCERDYWMNANEAVSYGIVDKILTKLK